jgi:hypothetical protein
MGIIMKNTAILKANTSIAGHSQWFPTEDFEDFVVSYFGNNREIDIDKDSVKIEVFPKDILKLSNDEFSSLNEAVDKYGQTYFPWVSQGDADRMVAQQDLERQKNKFNQMYGDIGEYIAEFNQNSRYKGEIEVDYNTNKLYWVVDQMNFLDLIGFYDWMMMPDGSDAFSDFGIEPLERILSEYDEELPPEKVLVIVNKALDVYHQRGDMASIFVTGGSRALSKIAEHAKKSKKKIYLSENQLKTIFESRKKGWTFDHFRKQEGINNNFKMLLEYPHYFVHFLTKWGLVDDWDEEPFSTLYDLCEWVFGEIDEGDDRKFIDAGKKEIYNLITNNEFLSSLVYRYIEDYIKPRKYKQDIVDRYTRKENLKDIDWTQRINQFEITDTSGRIKTYLKY